MSQSKQRLPYVKISDRQRELLLQYCDHQGMTSTRKEIHPVIQKAAEETGLSEERVKVYYNFIFFSPYASNLFLTISLFSLQKWISNEKKKRTATTSADERSSKKARFPSFKRGPSSYNLFCSEFFRSGKERNIAISEPFLYFVLYF